MKHYSTPDILLKDICGIFNAPISLIKGKSREQQLVKIRFYYSFIATKYYQFPLKCIGKEIGGRDHTTVMHGRDTVIAELEVNNTKTLNDIAKIKHHLDIQDSLHLDYRNLLELNKQLLERIKDLRKEVVLYSHENLKLKNELNYQKKLTASLYEK
jgi:Bacterial dnaA protein helix-turn-helix